MANALQPNKVGLAFGGMFGFVHLVWSLLVAVGWAAPVMYFILELHMIEPTIKVLPFSFGSALGLIVVTSVVGYVLGFVFANIWNKVQK